ncbi:MAG: hypothetical protein H8E37_12025, partial [Planctomycetes bacterium]|nr:hypothetical protein [Planctomycetota bacterium]
MAAVAETISTIDELRDFVHLTLCAKENLVEEQFQLQERDLKKLGKPCGLQFSLFGPRQVRLSAVWASDRNVLYFYDTRGTRYLKVQLRHRIAVEAQEIA